MKGLLRTMTAEVRSQASFWQIYESVKILCEPVYANFIIL